MRIAFRTDASIQIGTGHVMRCLTLADELHRRGAKCSFICRSHKGHLLEAIAQRGHEPIALPAFGHQCEASEYLGHSDWLGADWVTDANQTLRALSHPTDWLVVDHYALDSRWEQTMRPASNKILVIDDLADRPHECDLLLDQNLGRSEQDYVGLFRDGTEVLIGPKYALLRPEFEHWREYSLKRRAQTQLKHLLVTMGGVDKGNVTGQVLNALQSCQLSMDLNITVVMGPHAPWLAKVQEQAAQMPTPVKVFTGINNMAKLMADSDLAIGAAGGTALERCVLGLPTLMFVLAENQHSGAMALQAAGAAVAVHDMRELKPLLHGIMPEYNHDKLQTMAAAAGALADGSGISRVIERVFGENV